MGQVTVRDLDDTVIDRLLRQAERNRRSLEQELREILTRVATPANGSGPGYGQRSLEQEVRDALERAVVPRDPAEWEALLRDVDATRAMTPKVLHQSDSTALIREDRDSR